MPARRLTLGLFGLLGGGLFVWLALATIQESQAARSLADARDLMDAGRFPDARKRLETLPRSHREGPEARYRLGVCAHAAGEFPAAVALWGQVPAGNSWTIPAALASARTLYGDLGRLADAERVLEALRLAGPDPSLVEVRHTLSQFYFLQGRREAMRRLIESGWRHAPDPVAELRDHWRIDNATPMVDYIEEEITRAGKLAPEDDRVWLGKAFVAAQRGHGDEAARWLDRCLSRRPDDPAVRLAQLDLARLRDDPDAAADAIAHLPADAIPLEDRLSALAWLASRRNRPQTERKALQTLVTARPGQTVALDRLATMAWEAAESDQATTYRREKTVADEQKERYFRRMEGTITPENFPEMGELADALGRRFEAEGWWTLASRGGGDVKTIETARTRLARPTPADPPFPSAGTLASAFLAVDPELGRRKAAEVAEEAPALVQPVFTDEATAAGLVFTLDNGKSPERQLPETTAGGVALLDYDGDGYLDVYLVQGGTFPPKPGATGGDRLFRNLGDGTFEDATDTSGIAALARGYGHGVTVGDIDNDGDPDLFLTRWRAYQLLRNKGDGTFEDATAEVGLDGDRDWPTSAALADLDNDGDLDLYVCHYLVWDADHPALCEQKEKGGDADGDPGPRYDYCMPRQFPALPDHLFRNDNGQFVDVTAEAGIVDPDGRGLGVVAADIDNDGLMDLFVANDTTANYLLRNLGGMKFEEVGLASGVGCNAGGAFQAGMGTACGDLDGDGKLDLLVTNFYGECTTFFRNLGEGMFADQSAAIGLSAPTRYLLGFGIVPFDANADGRLDLATANGHVNDDRPNFPLEMPGLLVAGGPDGRLRDVTPGAGPAWSVRQLGRALAAGDIDNDGRVDLVYVAQNTPVMLLRNQTEGGGAWITVELEGKASNRDAVGAVLTLRSGTKSVTAARYGGGSFQSASDRRIHIGLGNADRVDRLTVRWPSGREEHFDNLEARRGYRLREGDANPHPLPGFATTTTARR